MTEINNIKELKMIVKSISIELKKTNLSFEKLKACDEELRKDIIISVFEDVCKKLNNFVSAYKSYPAIRKAVQNYMFYFIKSN